jgi:hypothetical protein
MTRVPGPLALRSKFVIAFSDFAAFPGSSAAPD